VLKYMADIQSTAAEIRRGKKEDRRKKEERNYRAKYNGPLLHRAAIIGNSNAICLYMQSLLIFRFKFRSGLLRKSVCQFNFRVVVIDS